MHRGYVKNWRKSLENPFFKKPLLWHFWNYCLLKATHKKTEVFINGAVIKLNPGQFIFGRKTAAKETGLTEQTVRTCLKHFKKSKNLTIQSTNRYSIISIINWDIYQQDETQINQHINQLPTINQPATNHIQECK